MDNGAKIDRWINMFLFSDNKIQQDGFALIIHLGRVLGGVGNIPTTYIYPACWGWIKKRMYTTASLEVTYITLNLIVIF